MILQMIREILALNTRLLKKCPGQGPGHFRLFG